MPIQQHNLGEWAIGPKTFEAICTYAKGPILELGSGTGSIELAKKFELVSIEDDIEYVKKYQGEGKVRHVPLNGVWYDVPTLRNVLKDTQYNFIVVDGPAGSLPRLGFYFNYYLFRGVSFIIDDAHRESEAMMVRQFQNMGMDFLFIDDGDKKSALWLGEKR